ncbi:hypothetical protein diail_11608 [Diaporthe ilicicola]|nr:hypothetical protein diail_11608 [Diaporthe ilicicola]
MSSSPAQPPPGVDPIMFARRNVGRSPEEHAALERALAERRRRRGAPASDSSSRRRSRSPAARRAEELANLAQRRWALEEREQALEERVRALQEWEQALHEREQALHEREQALHERERAFAQWLEEQEFELMVRRQEQDQRAVAGLVMDDAEIDPDQALLALPVAQRRAAILAPFGVTGGRPRAKGKSKGAGWHKRGYRDSLGCMWINVKVGDMCTKGQDVSERSTLAGFVQRVQMSQENSDYGYQAQRGMAWDLLFRRKSLRKLLADLEDAGLEEEDVLVRDLLDGGETVYYRLYDEDGTYT